MPDVVGMDLQQAQDHIQAVTELWYSDSRDATGQGREQLMDSNRVVVGQTPAVVACSAKMTCPCSTL